MVERGPKLVGTPKLTIRIKDPVPKDLDVMIIKPRKDKDKKK